MYERNAIIIDRYFNDMFGYNIKYNIKKNFNNYCELIEVLEKFKNITEEEEEIIIEYDIIANKIREIQNKQEKYNKKNLQLQQIRNDIFQNIDEDANLIRNKLEKINSDILEVDENIKENALDFTNVIAEFNEKSSVRAICGKNRRAIEKEYNKQLNDTLDNYKNIDNNIEKKAKQFVEKDTTDIEEELKNKIIKNGENEKIPFKKEVIEQAIILSIDIQKRETDILSNIYDKNNKLFSEIKNNTVKIEKHKKIILDTKCKLEIIAAIKEYLVQFLDNERLATVNGENEYNKLMDEACHNLNEDLIQINNLYLLLIKEITKKATKKAYNDLYHIEYIRNLEENEEEFEKQVKKLKLPVAVINPNHWRIDGIKRIYEVFNKCVIENYNKDLKKIVPIDDNNSEEDGYNDESELVKNINENTEKNILDDDKEVNSENYEQKNEDDEIKTEIDKKIDMILGIEDEEQKENHLLYNKSDNNNIEDDEWEEDYEENDNWKDEEDDFDWDDKDGKEVDEWDDKEIFGEEIDNIDDIDDDDVLEDDDWKENEDIRNSDNNYNNEKDYDYEDIIDDDNNETYDDYDDEIDYDIWGNNITKNKKSNHANDKQHFDDWENEFINIGKRDKNKKKGFFDKFIK